MQAQGYSDKRRLEPYISPQAAWALALGTSIGWGSLVVTSNAYLLQAGPFGSVLGMLVGALVMLIISCNYHYMMNCCPEAGGSYAFVRETFGYDHGFLSAWFLMLTYLAMLWANATSLPLFARYFIGNLFEFGRLYSVFGYQVYLGEALLSIAAIWGAAVLCARRKRATGKAMVGLVGLFTAGITICFTAAMTKRSVAFSPEFIPDSDALSQIVKIACISPWAFIGFENISHASEEFTFSQRKSFRVLVISVLTTTILYVFVTLLSVTAFPARYDSWLSYIRDLGNLSGIEGLPAFYAARHYLGGAGVGILMASLLCLIITSLIGNILALSRLFYSMGRDGILSRSCAALNEQGTPQKSIWIIAGISTLIPFVGRTAIGWIVDVTTLGATIIYGFVSASAWKKADFSGDRVEKWTGLAGMAAMIGVGCYLLLPNLFTTGSMETESYFLFVVWALLGFFFFRITLKRDRARRFGNSIVVWIALLALVLFVSLVWMSRSTMEATTRAMENVQAYYDAQGVPVGEDQVVLEQLSQIRRANSRSILLVLAMFGASLGVLLNNYSTIARRARESEQELGVVREQANTDAMTGVKSKRAWTEREEFVNRQIAAGSLEPMAVAVCDVNGLKHVNDTLGHKAGDEYICAASRLICEMFQHSPVFRIGGDEFVALLTGRDYENRQEILRQLNDRVESNIQKGRVVIAVGISDYEPGRDGALEEVFARADERMYNRKMQLKGLGAKTRD